MSGRGKKIRINRKTDALIGVDVMPTFMPSGGLPIKDGDKIVRPINHILGLFDCERVIFTLDLHVLGHVGLASSYVGLAPFTLLRYVDVLNWGALRLAPHAAFSLSQLKSYLMYLMPDGQMLWPDHAIDGTPEANLHPKLDMSRIGCVWVKGHDPACDSYSAIRDNLRRPTGLADQLRQLGVRRVFVCGLALDYCVGFTALDALAEGFEVYVIEDLARAVDPAYRRLDNTDVKMIRSAQLKK